MERTPRGINSIDFLQSGETGVRITDFCFDQEAYMAGNETDFLVSVAYRCPEGKDCVLMTGANTREPNSFAMMDEGHTVTGSGSYQLYVSVTPVEWDESYFGIYMNLSEADHAETRTPLAMNVLYTNINPVGNVSSDSGMGVVEIDQTGVLVAEVDNPLIFDEISFLEHSIEDLDIETARSLINSNFSDVSELGFDDDDDTWWLTGCSQRFGLGPDVSAMQHKIEDYIYLWDVASSLHYSAQEQLRTVRDIYTYD